MNLNEYPAAIEEARLRLQRLSDEAEKIREYMGEIEDQVTANVANALDENNKPLYSNETMRYLHLVESNKHAAIRKLSDYHDGAEVVPMWKARQA